METNGQSASNALALPRPDTLTLTQVHEIVLPSVAGLRDKIERRNDIPAARELCRQLEAFRKYLQDKEGRTLLAGECRRTEVLIGKLLPPAEETTGRKPDLSPVGERFSAIPSDDRYKFRLMATYEFLVEECIADGRVSRNWILEKIQRWQATADLVEDESETEILPPAPHWSITDVQGVIKCDALITDPPYGILDEKWEPKQLEKFTREWAGNWND